jgi:hypothetical protein
MSRLTWAKPSEDKGCIVPHADCVRGLAARQFLPLVKAVGRDQAAPLLEYFSVSARSIDALDSRIDSLEPNLGVLGPVGNEPPAESISDRWPVFGLKRMASTSWQGARAGRPSVAILILLLMITNRSRFRERRCVSNVSDANVLACSAHDPLHRRSARHPCRRSSGSLQSPAIKPGP